MNRGWPIRLIAPLLIGAGGCAQFASRPDYVEVVHNLSTVDERGPGPIGTGGPMAMALDPDPAPPGIEGPQPVDTYIRHALAENRLVLAARANVQALGYRIPQVTALDDPVVSNTIFPSPDNGQQTADGFMPWNLLIAQQFPWFGTLALRGLAAEQEVQVAIAELCAAQLDAVAAVKGAYAELHANEQVEHILLENRRLVEDFIAIARARYETGQAGQEDVLGAEVALVDLDRQLIATRQALAASRADLAQQLHVSPEADLRTLPDPPPAEVPDQIDRLYRLAVAARPELQGRQAAIARDATAVELARKRTYPDVTLGFNYGLMTAEGAVSPVAEGNDNLGLFVGLNLPIYRGKLEAAILEAQARTVADARLYDAERDLAYREIKDLMSQAEAQRDTLALLRAGVLPRARQALEVSVAAYQTGDVDFLTLITAWREVLQIELQVAQFEGAIGRSLAALERAVGVKINRHPPALPGTPEDPGAPEEPDASLDSAPPPTDTLGPFGADPLTDADQDEQG